MLKTDGTEMIRFAAQVAMRNTRARTAKASARACCCPLH